MAKQKTEAKKPRKSKKEQPKVPEQLPPAENVIAPAETKPEAPVESHLKDTDVIDWSGILEAATLEIAQNLIELLHVKFPELKPSIVSTGEVVSADKLLVDKKTFYEAMSALTQGHTYGYTMQPAMSKFAKMMGAKDRNEEIAIFNECQKYLKEIKK